MAVVREACSTLLSLRKSENLRVRLPLAGATVAVSDPALVAPHVDLMRDELNVKQIELTTDVDRFGSKQLTINPRALGPRLGGRMQDVVKAHKAGDWNVDGGRVVVGGVELEPGEYDFRTVSTEPGAVVAALRPVGGLTGGMVALDTTVTPELEAEGRARDLIRQIQQARRAAGLDVSDRIDLTIVAPAEVVAAFDTHRDLVMGEVLALEAAATEGGDEPVVTVRRVD
jgi:isoleucyl-tRNA synthetase